MAFIIEPYKALALQCSCEAVNRHDTIEARLKIRAAIAKTNKQIKASKGFIGQDLKLVVLPEYFLTGFPMGESIAEWQEKACIEMDGEEYDLLNKVAVDNNIYLSGNVYETDKHFPDLYFQTSFISSPEGKIILRYRRLNSMFAPTPHDVLEKYIDIYGKEALFPIVQTAIGNLACVASEEILYPEIGRCLMLNGAEIILHSSSEVGSPMATQKNIAKQARAIENMLYVISANSAGILDYDIPANSTDGHSQIINYEGLKLCEAYTGESMVANATIHIDALRYHRNRPGMSNFIARQRMELFSDTYNKKVYPANTLLNKNATRSHFIETQKHVIQSLKEKNIIQ
jgi:deaminated glutathione amidase